MADAGKDVPEVENQTAAGQEPTATGDPEMQKLKGDLESKTKEVDNLNIKVKELEGDSAK